MLKDTLTSEIQKYIDDNGGVTHHYGWYVGVTADPERRLFHEHKVNKQDGSWIYGPASSSGDARELERHFLDLGCQGGSGVGASDALYVYAYRITWYSQE